MRRIVKWVSISLIQIKKKESIEAVTEGYQMLNILSYYFFLIFTFFEF